MYILIFLITLLLISKSSFKNEGYSPESADYTKPKIYHGIISAKEANYIIKTAYNEFKSSETLGGYDQSIRKSKTAWLYPSDPVILGIIQRVCAITSNPVENCEAMQVVEYSPGGYYNQHHDSCCDPNEKCDIFVKDSGQRVYTMLIYLNDSFEGGETDFPNLKLKLKAPKYSGILFRPLANGTSKCHPFALHSGTPVKSGKKYVCNIWIREKPFK